MMLYDLGGRLEQEQINLVIKCVNESIAADCFMTGHHPNEIEQYLREIKDTDDSKKEWAIELALKLELRKRLWEIKETKR